MNYILITGCSTGIGYETAKYLKEKKYNIIATSRKQLDVKKLSNEFEHSIHLDVSSSKRLSAVRLFLIGVMPIT